MKTILLSLLFCLLFCISAFSQGAVKIDELTEHDCEGVKVRSFNLITKITEAKISQGYIIVYEGKDKRRIYGEDGKFKGSKDILPRFGEAISRMSDIKNILKFLQAPLDKIKVVNGGFRENYAIEFWFLPFGAQSPKPTPTLKNIRHRKGKIFRRGYWIVNYEKTISKFSYFNSAGRQRFRTNGETNCGEA